jgi:hypothetical protein
MSRKQRSRITRRTVSAAAAIAALASAVPVTQASAATPAVPVPAVPGLYGLPGLIFPSLPVLVPGSAYARGPTVIGDAFNGGTTVCVSIAASACSTNGSP